MQIGLLSKDCKFRLVEKIRTTSQVTTVSCLNFLLRNVWFDNTKKRCKLSIQMRRFTKFCIAVFQIHTYSETSSIRNSTLSSLILRGWACARQKPSTLISILAWNTVTPVKNTSTQGTLCLDGRFCVSQVGWVLLQHMDTFGTQYNHQLKNLFHKSRFSCLSGQFSLRNQRDLKHKRTYKHPVNIF